MADPKDDEFDTNLLRTLSESKVVFLPNNFWSPFDMQVLHHVHHIMVAEGMFKDFEPSRLAGRVAVLKNLYNDYTVSSAIHIII